MKEKMIKVEFSLSELLEIHRIIGEEIKKVDIFKANDLMRIVKEIESKTDGEMAWYHED